MNAMLNIALNDLRIFFNERASAILNLVVIPIVLSFVIGIANSGGGGAVSTPALPVDLVDEDKSLLSAEFIDTISTLNEAIVFCSLDAAGTAVPDACGLNPDMLASGAPVETLATDRLQDQTSLALIIIPAGFGSALNAGESVHVIYRSNEDANAPSYILQAVQAAAQQLSGAVVAQTVGMNVADTLPILTFADDSARSAFAASIREEAAAMWAQNPVTVEVLRVSLDMLDQAAPSGFTQSIPGIGSMYVMFAILPSVAMIITERKTWTLQRLATLPIPRWQVLGGKLLGRFVLGMIQYAIIFGFGLLLGVRYGNDPLALILLMVSFTVCITALALMLTGFLDNIAQAQGITLFITLTFAPLGGAWWPLDIVPAWMRTLGHISPIAWVMDGYQRLIVFSGSLVDILPFVGVLLAMAVIFFLIGVRRFRFS